MVGIAIGCFTLASAAGGGRFRSGGAHAFIPSTSHGRGIVLMPTDNGSVGERMPDADHRNAAVPPPPIMLEQAAVDLQSAQTNRGKRPIG